ncbi:flavodoxin domain-containing protein [Frankia sp. Ag45/Mut15]|uniref:Flavodoxin domain-containing protein n=1 Tax=Frankia umida TaxID=573489 RepID=A0ABT0JWI0_9ACTN|nr:flavodoxin domain-containing protein [Frankia umida]MCK9875902.1 flavodoxin domain-containing protein [Frankia umida]
MRALVVYGMRCGGADELARTIGTALAGHGVAAELRPARRVIEFEGYDAVVAAGAVRAGRWSGDVRRMIRNRRDALAELPVWLVAAEASSAAGGVGGFAPTSQLATLASLIGARGALTVGRQLSVEALLGLVEAVTALGAVAPARLLHPVPAWGPGARGRRGNVAGARSHLRLVVADGLSPHLAAPRDPSPDGPDMITWTSTIQDL